MVGSARRAAARRRRRHAAGRDRRARPPRRSRARRAAGAAPARRARRSSWRPRPRWRGSATARRSSRCCRCWRIRTRPCGRRRSARSTRSGIPRWRRACRRCSTSRDPADARVGGPHRRLLRLSRVRRRGARARARIRSKASAAPRSSICRFSTTAARSTVLLHASRTGTPKVRAAAAQALARMDGAEAGAALLDATRDADAWVRYYAARALGEQRVTAALPRLAELARDPGAMHVRIAALEALGAIAAPTRPASCCRTRTATPAELAAAALRGARPLSGDPRAAAALRAALRSHRSRRGGLPPSTGWRGTAATPTRVDGARSGRPGPTRTIASRAPRSKRWARSRDGPMPPAMPRPPRCIGADGGGAAARRGASPRSPAARRRASARRRRPRRSRGPRSAARSSTRSAACDIPTPPPPSAPRCDDAEPAVREAAITALDRLGARGTVAAFARDGARRRVAGRAPRRRRRARAGVARPRDPDAATSNDSQADSLGLSSSALPLLRDLDPRADWACSTRTAATTRSPTAWRRWSSSAASRRSSTTTTC